MRQLPEPAELTGLVAELSGRYAALRQAAALPGAEPAELLDAAFTELEGAIEALGHVQAGRPAPRAASTGADSAERRLLRAAFQDAPVPLFLLATDGTVQRVSKTAADLLGSKPGYATGRLFTTLVNLQSRAAVHTQLTAVARTSKTRRVACTMLGAAGPVACELVIGLVAVRGDADQLIVAVRDRLAGPGQPAGGTGRGTARQATGDRADPSVPVVRAITHRLDVATAVTRLLLESENFSESMTLQRCASLLAGELAAWVIVDVERRGRLRRQFVIGPPDRAAAAVIRGATAVSPAPGTLPSQVHESAQPALITHPEDPALLGTGPDGVPLLALMEAASVLAVPIWDGDSRYGVLTMARRAPEGQFELADLGLVEELGEQLGMAIRVDRMFRRHTEIAGALQASLLPRRLPQIPGIELAAAYMAATEGMEVGGDFYDVYRTPGGWGVAVGDVCGKGEEAAAVTAAARHSIRVIGHSLADPEQVLSRANEIMLAEELGGGFVTAQIAHLRWQGRALHGVLASAGNPGPVLVRPDGSTVQTGGGGLPLGLFADAESASEELVMTKGELLFLYTDGVTEARSPDRETFEHRLPGELARLAGAHPADVVLAMQRLVLDFSANNLADDLAMLAVRVGERVG